MDYNDEVYEKAWNWLGKHLTVTLDDEDKEEIKGLFGDL